MFNLSTQKSQLAYQLALLKGPTIGPITFLKLHENFPDLTELFSSTRTDLRSHGIAESLIEYLANPDWRSIECELAWQEQASNHILTYDNPDYPKLLRETCGAPPIIYVKGNLSALQLPQLAIVGTRHPTTGGSAVAYEFAEFLASNGLAITSGLALGIDSISHRGALAGKGITNAVLGSGLEKIYPARHIALAAQIIEQGGAIVSEYPPTTRAAPEHFPQRNRIISGLSLGVLVVEAALQSGSLITAKYALEQGREVFAIPGSIHNPIAKGCHALIKQGAKLVETSTDILEELTSLHAFLVNTDEVIKPSPLDLAQLDTHYRKLVECIDFENTAMDVIIYRSGLTAEVVSAMVLMLELQGYIQAVNGGYVRR